MSLAAESAGEEEVGRPRKAARLARPRLLDGISTSRCLTSYGDLSGDIAGCFVSSSQALSSAGSTESSTASANLPSLSASDTGSRCGSAPGSPLVRLDAPALADDAGLLPIMRACDHSRRSSRAADSEAARALSCEAGGADASAVSVEGCASPSVDSILRVPLALAEQQVYTLFATSVGIDDPKELERTMKARGWARAAV
jgi:hypothetical protein